MKKKKPVWTRTASTSTVILSHFPRFVATVAAQSQDWRWRLMLGNEGIALGDSDSRSAAEARAIAEVRGLLREIERACP